MSQKIEAFEKYLRCLKLNMPMVVQNCTTSPKVGLIVTQLFKDDARFKLENRASFYPQIFFKFFLFLVSLPCRSV